MPMTVNLKYNLLKGCDELRIHCSLKIIIEDIMHMYHDQRDCTERAVNIKINNNENQHKKKDLSGFKRPVVVEKMLANIW